MLDSLDGVAFASLDGALRDGAVQNTITDHYGPID